MAPGLNPSAEFEERLGPHRKGRVHHGGEREMRINTNIMALNAYNKSRRTRVPNLTSSLQKLSSGYRINKAA